MHDEGKLDYQRMQKQKALPIILSGLFLLCDQWLKWMALHGWSEAHTALHGWLGWEPFLNPGIAFSIPVPVWLTVIGTVPILIFLVWMLVRAQREFGKTAGILLIITGALSNLIDRITHGTTVDYLRIFTAVINLADVLIALGFVLYIISIRKKKE